jgi:hypothetical protein
MSKTVLLRHSKTSPTKTRLAIENLIKNEGYFESTSQLYKILISRFSCSRVTINAVLKNLKSSNKIQVNKDGSIVWIFSDKNDKLTKTIQKSVLLR